MDEETVYTTTSTSTWSKKSVDANAAKAVEKKESAPPAVKEPAAKSRAIAVSDDVVDGKEADGVDAPLFCEGGCIISWFHEWLAFNMEWIKLRLRLRLKLKLPWLDRSIRNLYRPIVGINKVSWWEYVKHGVDVE